jgi:hypothetical protein
MPTRCPIRDMAKTGVAGADVHVHGGEATSAHRNPVSYALEWKVPWGCGIMGHELQ